MPRRSPTRSRALLAALLPALLVIACPAGDPDAPAVAAGADAGHVRTLEAGAAHRYRFSPGAANPMRLVVEQRGIDIEVGVSPEGGESFVADGPFDRRGREAVLLEGAASYRVTVRGREAGAPPGRYALRLEPLAASGAEAAGRLAAARAETAAAWLYPQGTAEAWREAAGQLERASARWRALGQEREAALDLYAEAVLHRLVDAPRAGLGAARRVAAEARRLGEPLLEAYAQNEVGLDRWQLGEGDGARGARAAFRAAWSLGTAHEDRFVAAAAASNLCLMELTRGDLKAGRACYEAALPAIERAQAAQIESAARTNLGRLAEQLGEPDAALEHYRRALAVLAAAGDRRGQAQTLNNLGVLLRGLGALDAAMARYAEALEIFGELGERRWQARVLSNVGYAYLELHETPRAVVSFERARDLFRQVEDRRGEAATLDNLGIVERDGGRPERALALHRQALELRRRGGDRRGAAVTLRRIGEVEAALGDLAAARAALGEAVATCAEVGDRLTEALARRGLGEIELSGGDPEAARRQLEAALAVVGGAGQRTIEASILYQLARVERASGRSDAALRRVAAALDRLEDLRARIDSPELRTSYSALLRGAYELEVDLLMAAHRADPAAGHDRRALEVAERSRARALLDLLQEADVDLTAGVHPGLLARRKRLARRLDAKSGRLADPGLDAEVRSTLEADQLTLLQGLDVLDARIRRESPAYEEIVRPRDLAAPQVQALVDPDTVLAVYFLGEPTSHLWRVTAEAIDAFELPGRATLEAAARRVHQAWSELDVASRSRDHAAAEELAGMLRLPDLVGSGRLAVIADGALHLVPFAALPVPTSDSSDPSDPNGPPVPLVARAEVTFLPSASVLALDRRLHGGAALRRSVAILADPAFGPDYPGLPGSRIEAASIAAVTSEGSLRPGLTALGVDASRELLESGRLRDYGIVHLATHGVIDTENPALSSLVVSRRGARGRPQPGFLHLHEVFNLRLDADLVVLSGCRTALGPVVRGEGLIGLARGFMYAGSRRVVASLWPVEDRATAALMIHFYRALWDHGLPPAAALAVAQRELARTRRYRDPYFWAGFVLMGDWR
jgi:tetratricopeptide (TPR) repeat protein